MRGCTLRPIDVMFINGREMFPALNPLFGSLFHFTDPALYIPLHHHRHHHRCRFHCQRALQTRSGEIGLISRLPLSQTWSRSPSLLDYHIVEQIHIERKLSLWVIWYKTTLVKRKDWLKKKQSSKKIKKHRQRHTVPNIDKKENGRGF